MQYYIRYEVRLTFGTHLMAQSLKMSHNHKNQSEYQGCNGIKFWKFSERNLKSLKCSNGTEFRGMENFKLFTEYGTEFRELLKNARNFELNGTEFRYSPGEYAYLRKHALYDIIVLLCVIRLVTLNSFDGFFYFSAKNDDDIWEKLKV